AVWFFKVYRLRLIEVNDITGNGERRPQPHYARLYNLPLISALLRLGANYMPVPGKHLVSVDIKYIVIGKILPLPIIKKSFLVDHFNHNDEKRGGIRYVIYCRPPTMRRIKTKWSYLVMESLMPS
ncbi:MAG TPA: hypothetical protein VK141_00990, partial [Nitrosomonas sp.]|nr:hypothetical protein [Nitrosomonas sp.]